jgi:hypothetical protein
MLGPQQRAERVNPVAFGIGFMKLQENHTSLQSAMFHVLLTWIVIRVEARSGQFTVNEDVAGTGIAHSV